MAVSKAFISLNSTTTCQPSLHSRSTTTTTIPLHATATKPTALVAEKLSESRLKLLRKSVLVDCSYGLSSDQLAAKISSCDALIMRSGTKVSREVFAATEFGSLVVNAPMANTVAAAEHGIDAGTDASSPSKKIIIGMPTAPGTYPIILFFPGFLIPFDCYKQIINDISSLGFIVVGAQLYTYLPRSTAQDVQSAADLTNWLPIGLQNYLPNGVEPDFQKLALAGHSRGGHTAFALALGYAKTDLKFAAVIGFDPVLGQNKWLQAEPKILTYEPESLELKIPTLIIGTEFADKGLFPCAPDGVNHKQLYLECKQPRQHFVVPGSGHMDLLDDDAPLWTKLFFKNGHCRATVRREFVELTTAFLHTTHQRDMPEVLRGNECKNNMIIYALSISICFVWSILYG